nr:MAG TPA: structural protein [Caudoviricetes sp.]
MLQLNNKNLYAKGTCNVVVDDPLTGNVDYQSNKVQTANLTTSVNMNEVRAGLGNAIAIQLPSDSAVNLELTAADFSLEARAMQLGSQVTYNAPAPVCEIVTASSTTLSISASATAVAPQGLSKIVAYVSDGTSNAATAYTINNDTHEVVGFTATSGTTYKVYYWVNKASAKQLVANSVFSPAIKRVTIQIAVYSTENTVASSQSSMVGWLYCIIPRMQFSAKADTDGSQSSNATTALSGTALLYDPVGDTTVCTDCAMSQLAYWVYVPNGDAEQDVQGLVVIGGGVTVKTSATAQIPVRFLMADNSIVVPDYGTMTYAMAGDKATVSNTGVVTGGSSAGSDTCTITLKSNNAIKATCNVTVTA